jgi:hypothetical protein
MISFVLSMDGAPLNIRIRYEGDDVNNGTMPVDEVITALQGFAGAYGKAANELMPSSVHELRVSAVNEGSFEVAILAWIGASQFKETLEALNNAADGAKYIFGIVRDVINGKKHIKSKPFTVSVRGDNNTTLIINADGAALSLPPEAIKLLQSNLLDIDLGKIASPLSDGLVERAEITARDEHDLIEAKIDSAEKSFFAPGSSFETSKEAEISGTLISLNKETLRGTFKRNDGHKFPYRYIGENSDSFFSGFSHNGLVRASCIAFFDENLELKRLDITRIISLQSELPFFVN